MRSISLFFSQLSNGGAGTSPAFKEQFVPLVHPDSSTEVLTAVTVDPGLPWPGVHELCGHWLLCGAARMHGSSGKD